ncbi:MAG: hypothetical protein M1828_006421 [Chrysothrix sp. TS-e1954]|nr:MAG: hypothetical protein M1828_006421 [Chrysothrix sp. TS-e1954]
MPPSAAEDKRQAAREIIDILHEISVLLNTNLDRNQLSLCVSMIENGVNPEALALAMVYYYTSSAVSPAAQIYVGKDKFENEDLIKHGLDEDICAHVYYRLQDGQTWDAIPEEVLKDCAQLTKANSIDGNKKDNVTVIYTPWSNLKKDGGMVTGQVGFKDQRKVKKIHIPERENPIVNRLNKTKVERFLDLRAEKEEALKQARSKDLAQQRERQKAEAKVAKERKEKAWQRDHAYDDLHSEDAIAASSNQNRGEDFEDDFM